MVVGWEGSTPRPQGGMGEWQLSVSWGIRKIRDQTIKTLNITNKNPFYLNFIGWLVGCKLWLQLILEMVDDVVDDGLEDALVDSC